MCAHSGVQFLVLNEKMQFKAFKKRRTMTYYTRLQHSSGFCLLGPGPPLQHPQELPDYQGWEYTEFVSFSCSKVQKELEEEKNI